MGVLVTRCPFATWKPIGANFTQGGRRPLRGFVPHVQVGTGSLWGFFNTPKPKGQGASADFWCSQAGELEQYVDLADQSWAQGSREHNGNPYFVSCEFEGMPDEPMTPQQIAKGGQLIAWLRDEVNDFPLQVNTDPDGFGVTPHHVFGGGHTCPGPGPREGQFVDLIAAAQPPEEEDMTPSTAQDEQGVVHAFCRGGDGKAYVTFYTDKWQPWQTLGGSFISGIDANRRTDGTIDLVGTGTDHAIYHAYRAPGGQWSGWESLGGWS